MRNWAHGSNRLKALGWAEMWSSKRSSSAPTTPCNHGFVGVLSLGHGCDRVWKRAFRGFCLWTLCGVLVGFSGLLVRILGTLGGLLVNLY